MRCATNSPVDCVAKDSFFDLTSVIVIIDRVTGSSLYEYTLPISV